MAHQSLCSSNPFSSSAPFTLYRHALWIGSPYPSFLAQNMQIENRMWMLNVVMFVFCISTNSQGYRVDISLWPTLGINSSKYKNCRSAFCSNPALLFTRTNNDSEKRHINTINIFCNQASLFLNYWFLPVHQKEYHQKFP